MAFKIEDGLNLDVQKVVKEIIDNLEQLPAHCESYEIRLTVGDYPKIEMKFHWGTEIFYLEYPNEDCNFYRVSGRCGFVSKNIKH